MPQPQPPTLILQPVAYNPRSTAVADLPPDTTRILFYETWPDPGDDQWVFGYYDGAMDQFLVEEGDRHLRPAHNVTHFVVDVPSPLGDSF